MLDEPTRGAILTLSQQGHGIRAIARLMGISRGAVRQVLRSGSAAAPSQQRPELGEPHDAEIRALHAQCRGNLVRVHEELQRLGVELSYSALTGYCRRHGIGYEAPKPAGRYVFEPGQEMQHDTSPHRVVVAGTERTAQTASLVFCYSRMRFLQMYPRFDRFTCKLFLEEASVFFGGFCGRCMIDNTHVVVLTGTGATMVAVPEMEAFGRRYGFVFVAHEKGDANRSAHVERGFDHFERNFLAGRTFEDFTDANRQARQWCEQVNSKQRRELQSSSRELFVKEVDHLQRRPAWVPEVYRLHHRIVDTEGFVHVDGHIYSVPWQLIGRRVEVRESATVVSVLEGPRLVAEHPRATGFTKSRTTAPAHRPPRGEQTKQRNQPTPDESLLTSAGEPLASYALAVKQRACTRWPMALRRLAQMWHDYPSAPFLSAVTEAAHFGLYDLERLDTMVLRRIAGDFFPVSLDSVPPDDRAEPEGAPSEGRN